MALTELEQDFAETLATTLEGLSAVQGKARLVVESGGDCRAAFLAALTDDTDRAQVSAQWPMIQLLLGV